MDEINWDEAPPGTVAHAFDKCGDGFFYYCNTEYGIWYVAQSSAKLKTGEDWTKSWRTKP